MRIAVVTSSVPFVHGGANNFVNWLVDALRLTGHQAELISLPYDETPSRIPAQMAMFRMIDLSDQADLAICVRPPAYLVRHPRKVLWFIHHMRAYYDLWETPYAPPHTHELVELRTMIHRVDTAALGEATRIFTNSETVSSRLREFNGIDSEVLYPPLPLDYVATDDGLGDEIVAISRLEPHKRQHLLIAAMAHTKTPVTLRLLGASSTKNYTLYLRSQIALHRLQRRITLDDRWATEDEKRTAIAGALAGAYVPEDEDSYGYPTLEYAIANKPVLSVSDSGGVAEFLRDGVEGLMTEPTAKSLGAAMDRLYEDRETAARMGRSARGRIDELGISWEHVVERLTAS